MLPPSGKLRIQQILGALLCYSHAVDCTLLVAINSIASVQTKSTHNTLNKITQLLNYCATHPDSTVRYKARDMILHVESDASYLSEPQSKSRAGGHFYRSSNKSSPNVPIFTECSLLKKVLSSSAESELSALFNNGKSTAYLRHILQSLGHLQPPTPIKTDSALALGIIYNTVKQRKTKSINMRFYWLQDQVNLNQFSIFWRPGIENLADYFTKHHPASHHKRMRPQFLLSNNKHT